MKDIESINLPDYAELSNVKVELSDMGERNISADVLFNADAAPDMSQEWAIEYKGEKYISPLRKPAASIDNESVSAKLSLTFQHWAEYQLKRWYFFTVQQVGTGVIVADKYAASVSLDLKDFCNLFGWVLTYYYKGKITIDLNPNLEDTEVVTVSINNSLMWDVLSQLYDLYAVHWQIVAASDNDNTAEGGERYVIKVGYETTELTHIFEYGFEKGLLKVERQVQNSDIRNILIGRGGSKNLPYRYYKDVDVNNPSFAADPDFIPELANTPFTQLRGATFRSYVQGWKAKHHGGTTTAANAYAPWAWNKGYTDAEFDTTEYVKDDDSIVKYGELMGILDDNEDFYPSIQNRTLPGIGRVDETVCVDKMFNDDFAQSGENDAIITQLGGLTKSSPIAAGNSVTLSLDGSQFTVEEGHTANLIFTPQVLAVTSKDGSADFAEPIITSWYINVFKVGNDTNANSASGIGAGKWYYKVSITVQNPNTDEQKILYVTVGDNAPKLNDATIVDYSNTWCIWIKNIWNSTRNKGESDVEFANRVWKPILGDKEGETARVAFSDGWLAISEDYEFTIVKVPEYDNSKTLNGVSSCWKLTLAKSDADYKSTGKYLPNNQTHANDGDHFLLLGIDVPHQYVLWAEEALDNYNQDQLKKLKDIVPTWNVSLDKVRIGRTYGDETQTLLSQLAVGSVIRLADKRFITDTAYEKLFIQKLTLNYGDDTLFTPEVEITLSNDYTTTASPVSIMSADISALQKQMGSISTIEQIVQDICDRRYLRKDGIADRSVSPTEFASRVSSNDFKPGIGGTGWGAYKDANGRWVYETDRIKVREDFEVNNFVINQVQGRGGTIIETAAYIEVTRVEETDIGYYCYFDQKQGSVANLFREYDVAWCQRYDPSNNTLKNYKRRVIWCGVDCIYLTKGYPATTLPDGSSDMGVYGDGVPEVGDCIIQYGNYQDATRQYAKINDVVGGGYTRYISGLTHAAAQGTEYVFLGRQDGRYNGKPAFFVGDDKSFVKYSDGVLNIKGKIDVSSTIGDKDISDIISDNEKSSYVLEIINSMAGVACDSTGKVIGTYPNSRAVVYKAGTALTSGVKYSIASKTGITTASISTAGVVLMTGMTADTASIIVQAEVDGVTLQNSISLYKVKPGQNGQNGADGKDGENGENGQDAVVYSITPSVNSVTHNADGTLSATSVTCTKYKTTGNSERQTTTECVLKARVYINGVAGSESTIANVGTATGVVSVSTTTTAIEFTLYNGETILDKERVPVLTDATGLVIGGTNLLANTNKGTRGWTPYFYAGTETSTTKITLSSSASTKGVYIANNQVGTPANNWQFVQFQIPNGKLLSGRQYTLSFKYYGNTATEAWVNVGVFKTGGQSIVVKYLKTNLAITTDRTAVQVTFTLPTVEDGYALNFQIIKNTTAAWNWTGLTIYDLKLEEGNVATDWSPAPEDVDYLTAALKEATSIEGGLILASLLQLGYTSSTGYKVMSGVNGIYAPNEPGGGLSFWSGGEMNDIENVTADAATYGIRMDGTGWACGGEVQFKDNAFMAGDNVRLDKNGLTLFDGTEERLRIINGSVGSEADMFVNSSININQSFTPAIKYKLITTASSGISLNPGLYISGSDVTLYKIGALTSTSNTINVNATLSLTASSGGLGTYGTALFELVSGTGSLLTVVKSWQIGFRPNNTGSQHTASISISQVVAAGTYYLRVSVVADSAITNPSSKAGALTMKGSAEMGMADKNLLGKDGFLSKWGSSGLLVKSGLILGRVGNYGIKVQTDGVYIMQNGTYTKLTV